MACLRSRREYVVIMMSTKTWIVVGHRAGARILERKRGGLQLLSEIVHEAGKLKDGEINSDRPGRAFDRTGGGRHAMSSQETPHDHVAGVFARELAETLRAGRLEHRFDRLVLVAEPRFMGMLRGALDGETAALIHDTVGKDLAKVPVDELSSHLPTIGTL